MKAILDARGCVPENAYPWLHVFFYAGAASVFGAWERVIVDDDDPTAGFEMFRAIAADLRDTALAMEPLESEALH